MEDILGGEHDVRLSIIIINYNSREEILDCLDSLERFPTVHATEVIVVDNASSDGSPEEIERLRPDVNLIANLDNVGYSRGVNQGIRSSSGEFFLVLNPDVRVTEGSLDLLLECAMENPDVGIAGSMLLNPEGTLQHSCRSFYTWKTLLFRRTPIGKLFPDSQVIRDHLMLDWDHKSTKDVDWMLGACLLVRRSAVDEVGAMDERFFLYFEDVDWCYRMKAHGWRVVYVAESVMIHQHRRDSARKLFNRQTVSHLSSMFRFFDKWSHFVYRMKARRHWARLTLSLLSDIAMINLSFLIAYGVRLLAAQVFTKPVFTLSTYGVFLLFINLTLLVSLSLTGFYREVAALPGPGLAVDRFLRALRAAGLAYLVITAATFLTQSHIYSRILVTIHLVLLVFLLTLGRYLLARIFDALRQNAYNLRRAIVVGSNDLSFSLAEQLRTFPDFGFDLVGFVCEEGESTKGRGVLGGIEDLPRLVREHRVTDVFYAGDGDPLPVVSRLILRLPDAPVVVRVLSDLAAITVARGKAEEFLNLPVLRFERRTLVSYRPGWKRLFDIAVSLAGIVITFPLFLLILLLGVFGGVRPVFSIEKIPHFRGVFHKLNRFRIPADGEGNFFAARLRSLFIRTPALASLPALYAVLSGRFSFVGPYPQEQERGRFLDEWQRILVTMKPGLCRVSAAEDHSWVPFRDPVGLNLYYLQYWSVGFDLQIVLRRLFRSVSAVEGASNEEE